MYAIEQAVRQGDSNATTQLIEQLEADDPAVRMMAIAALERLTGTTHGYIHYAPLHERRAAIARWQAASEQGELTQGARSDG